jgi:hypothetical protein
MKCQHMLLRCLRNKKHNQKVNGRFHVGYISIADGTNSTIIYRSCRQLSEGAYMENRGRECGDI